MDDKNLAQQTRKETEAAALRMQSGFRGKRARGTVKDLRFRKAEAERIKALVARQRETGKSVLRASAMSRFWVRGNVVDGTRDSSAA